MKPLLMALLVVTTVAVSPALAQTPMRDGQWEVTMQMEMPGMPMQMPAMKSMQCVTKEQLKDPGNALPKGPDSKDCKVSDYKAEGSKVSWKMACTGAQKMSGSGEIAFKGDSYDGAMTMTMDPQGEMKMKLSGKRVGDCGNN
jgi:hypothetical protein